MKKLFAVLLVVILIGVTSVGVAGKAEKLSAAAINIMLDQLQVEVKDYDYLFNHRKTMAIEDEDGDVSVFFESQHTRRDLLQVEKETIQFLCDMWESFYEIHSKVSTAGLYVSIWNGQDCIYFTGGALIIDYYGDSIPFVHSSNKI